MKTLYSFSLLGLLFFFIISVSFAQNKSISSTNSNIDYNWKQKADFGGTKRAGAFVFVIGTKGYIGTGGGQFGVLDDFWEYDSDTNIWTKKANFGGGARWYAKGFAIGGKGYVCAGILGSGQLKQDLWEYDPIFDTWTQKADFGGGGRVDAVAFSIGLKGYVGTGYGLGGAIRYNDFWEYDPAFDTWTQKANVGGQSRSAAVGFSIGSKGYIGTGSDATGNNLVNDFWEYNPNNDTWTQKANVGEGARASAVGFAIEAKGYIGNGASISSNNANDFWEYDALSDTWTQKANYGGRGGIGDVGFSVGSKGYIGTGSNNNGGGLQNDFWEYSPTVFFSNAKIENLTETVNKTTYNVVREATIHHYYLVKNTTTNTPLQNVIIQYTLSNSPSVVRNSLPSGADGLIDLNIKIGGDNPNSSSDDWLGVGSATISFVGTPNVQTITSNVFGANAFAINVIDKALPISKEYGFAFDLAVGAGMEFGKKISIGSYQIGAKAASLKGGVTFGPSFVVNPVTEDFWIVKMGSSLGFYGEASLGPEFSYHKSKVKVGPSLDVGLNLGTRNEIGYDVDLTQDNKLFKLASVFCLAKAAQDPNLKMFAGFFNNLSQSVLPRNSESISNSFGASYNLGVGLSIENQIENLKGYGKISNLEIGGGISVEGSMNIESKIEKINSVGSRQSLNITAGAEASAGYDELISINDESVVVKNLTSKIYSNSSTYKFSILREFDINDNQNGGSFSFGSEKDETINGISDYKVNANNNYIYSNKVLSYLSGSLNQSISNNGLAAFFIKGQSLPSSLWQAYTSSNSIFKNVFDLNYFVLQNFQTNWTTDDVLLSTTRDITLMKSPSISFSIGLGLNLDFNFGCRSWNSYTHNFKEAVFSKSLQKKLLTVDMPEIYSNIEIPQTEVMGYFWNKVEQKVIGLLAPVAQNAYNFVRDVSQNISSGVQTIFSNFSNPFGTRALMNGQVIYDAKSKNPILTTNVPSVFTFTINPSPQVFNANTSLRFKYYYPENEIQAITLTDTLRIVSDVFFLEAKDGTTILNQAPNGNFSIVTQFSIDDLKLASLPLNSVAVVLFLPNGSSVWENIGSANQTISFNCPAPSRRNHLKLEEIS